MATLLNLIERNNKILEFVNKASFSKPNQTPTMIKLKFTKKRKIIHIVYCETFGLKNIEFSRNCQ